MTYNEFSSESEVLLIIPALPDVKNSLDRRDTAYVKETTASSTLYTISN